MRAYEPKLIASRIQQLVEAENGGDVEAAARRLGLTSGLLIEMLEGAPCEKYLAALAAVIRGYEVDAIWLLTGEEGVSTTHLSPELRLECAELLSQIGREIIVRRHRLYDSDGVEDGRAIA